MEFLKDGKLMSAFLIDYENINGVSILPGLDLLSPQDKLILFYSKACSSLRKECWDIIESSACEFSTVKLLQHGRDYLDKYICTAVGETHAKGEKEIAIISRDKGFQAVIDYYKSIQCSDFKVVKAESIEQAMLSFGNPSDKKRRSIISERNKKISIDEISIRLKERTIIKERIRKALAGTPYQFMVNDICEFVSNREEINKRSLYTGAMHSFGRENGRALYNIIKDVV